jgi:hypothetical protein
MNQHEESLVLAVLSNSIAWRVLRRLARSVHVAAAGARITETFRADSVRTHEWIQLTGYVVLSAAISNALLLAVLPRTVVGYVPLFTSLSTMLIGVALVLWPNHAARAWSESRLHRAYRRVFRDTRHH